jgi:hypothetical protein
MMIRNRFGLVVAFACGIAGCGLFGSSGGGARADPFGEPDWVERGSAHILVDDSRYFVGVGAARGKLNASLLKAAAKKKAKDAVEQQLAEYLDKLAAPWIESLPPKIEEQANPRGMLASLNKRIHPRIQVEETYVSGDGRAAFVQARLQLIAVLMEMEASADTEPMRAFLNEKRLDPRMLFDYLAGAGAENEETPEGGGEAPEEDEGGEAQ